MIESTVLRVAFAALCVGLSAVAQEPAAPPAQDPPAQDPLAEMRELFEAAGLRLDLEQKTVAVPCVFGEPSDPLEFVLIHPRGKTHESLLITEVPASVLNGALLALGFDKGENVKIVERDPLPTAEEVEAGAKWFDLFPPKGQQIWLTVSWETVVDRGDKVEKVRTELAVEDLILDLAIGRPIEDASFIYLGGQMAALYRGEPPVFMADYEGNYVSCVYKPQPNHLVTILHEAADDDQRWWITDRMQLRDTPATVVFHATEPPVHKARRERIEKARGKDGDGDRDR